MFRWMRLQHAFITLKDDKENFNPFQPSNASYRNQSFDLIANQMTGFYRKCNSSLKWVKQNTKC